MRPIRFALALVVAMAAHPAGAVFYPYEGAGGGEGLNRSNNIADISPVGACSSTVGTCTGGSNQGAPCNPHVTEPTGCLGGGTCTVSKTVTLAGCRSRAGTLCATGTACDLERVPEFRCGITFGTITCLWPNGSGFCNNDPNRGCITDSNCPSGTCNQATASASCVCQGTDNNAPNFEALSNVCGTVGVCSDGDGAYPYAPTLHGGLATAINFGGGSGNGTNAGRGAGIPLTGPRSGFENPPVLVSGQRAPGLGDLLGTGAVTTVTPILDLRATLVYDIGPIETNRGGIRRISLKGDSVWTDIPYGDQDITGAPVSSNGPTTYYFFGPAKGVSTNPPMFYNRPLQGTCVGGDNAGRVCIDEPTCDPQGGNPGTCVRTLYGHQAAIDTIGYIWTQNWDPNDPNFRPPLLDVDMDSQLDSPPHTGLDYDLDTLEQMTIEAANLIDQRAGAQLAFDFLVGATAQAGDSVGTVSIESNTWASSGMPDMRCFMAGDPAIVCATCGGGVCGTAKFCVGGGTNGKPGIPCIDETDCEGDSPTCEGLACTTDADCQQYVGRCADSTGKGAQPCDPLDNGTIAGHTDCPAATGVQPGQACHACFGPVAVGACVGGANVGQACRVDSQCTGSTCGIDVDGAGTGAGVPKYAPNDPNDAYETGEVAAGMLDPNTLSPNGGNPWGLPPGYTTYGFPELELDTKCSPLRAGRVGIVSPMVGISPAAPERQVAVPLAFIATTGKAASQVVDMDVGAALGDDAIFGRAVLGTAQIGIAEPGAPGTPLSGGTFLSGRIFPVAPSGPACCGFGGNILTTKNTTYGNARANVSVNASNNLTWQAGTQGTQPPTIAFMRAGAWGPGANRVPGCIGDNSEVTGQSAFLTPSPCNDPLGSAVAALCSGGDCDTIVPAAPANPLGAGNTGADDTMITGSIGGGPTVHVIAARAKVGSPGGTDPNDLPIIYSVGGLTGIDLDIGAPAGEANTDFSATVETFTCPLVGTCATGGTACVLDSHCTGGSAPPCQNRVKACRNIFDPCVGLGDFDMDGVCDPTDSCPTVDNTGTDPDMDGVDQACDNCYDVANPPFSGTLTNRHRTGGGTGGLGQLDDDVDGRGNHCDMDFNQAATNVGGPDTALMVAALNPVSSVNDNDCGPAGTSACGIHDLNGAATNIGGPDTALLVGILSAGTVSLNAAPNRHCGPGGLPSSQTCGQNPNQPCCSPFSRPLGSVPGPTEGKAICLNSTGAQQRCVYAN